ncbi:MAG: hypothetical protein IJH78_06100 [Clostridia bacterium]|nr:hypothetical protein [Clostridia bacterium]
MKRDRNGLLSWNYVALVLLLALIVAFFGALLIQRTRSQYNSVGSYRTLDLQNIQKLETVSDGFIYYDGSSVMKVDTGAKVKWSFQAGNGADFSADGSEITVWNGRRLMVINHETGVSDFSGSMDEEILSARAGTQFTAVLLGPEHNSTIILMESGGTRIDSITLADQTVIDYGFFFNGTLFWVMTLDTNGTAPSCTVNVYRPGRRMVGSITDSEQLFYHVSFESSQILCVGETYLRSFSYNGTENADERRLIYGWTLANSDQESALPLMAFIQNGDNDGSNTIQNIRLIRADSDEIMRLPFGCSSLFARGTNAYAFSTDGYVMIARLGQRKVEAYNVGLHYDRVYGLIQDRYAVLGTGSIIYLVALK